MCYARFVKNLLFCHLRELLADSYRIAKGIFIFLCFFTILIAMYFSLVGNITMSVAFTSCVIACLSVYLGLHSIELGKESTKIADESKQIASESKKMMEVVSRFAYNETIGIFEDRRLTMRDKLLKIKDKTTKNMYDDSNEFEADKTDYLIDHSFSIWKCTWYLRNLMEYKEWMEKADEKQIIHYVTNFFNDVIDGMVFFKFKITEERFGNIKGMYETVKELKSFDEHDEKVEFEKSFKLLEKIQTSSKKKQKSNRAKSEQ